MTRAREDTGMSEKDFSPPALKVIEKLLKEVDDLRRGVPYHTHRCMDHDWRCTSPYCTAIAQRCLEHDGGPVGAPGTSPIDPNYARD